MGRIKGLIATEIVSAIEVHSPRGRYFTMSERETYGLSLCRSGKITYRHQGRQIVSDPSCAVILPMNASYELYGNETGDFPVINFHCRGFQTGEFLRMPLSSPERLLKDFERLKRALLFPENGLHAMRVFYELLERLDEDDISEQTPLSPALHYLHEHFCDPGLDNALLAAQAGISETYFRRLFRRQQGVSPKQYILEVRMQRARQLLREERMSIARVAEESGFSSVYAFSRAFHRITGETPGGYRARGGRDGI